MRYFLDVKSQEPVVVSVMQSPSLASLALVAVILGVVVSAFLPDRSDIDRPARAYIPQLISQSR
jgi:hypothetical protein